MGFEDGEGDGPLMIVNVHLMLYRMNLRYVVQDVDLVAFDCAVKTIVSLLCVSRSGNVCRVRFGTSLKRSVCTNDSERIQRTQHALQWSRSFWFKAQETDYSVAA